MVQARRAEFSQAILASLDQSYVFVIVFVTFVKRTGSTYNVNVMYQSARHADLAHFTSVARLRVY